MILKIFKIKDVNTVLNLYPDSDQESLEKIRNNVSNDLKEAGEGRRIVCGAEVDGKTVGTAQLVFKFREGKKYYADGSDVAHVTHVRIAKDFRGEGFGRELMEFIENEAEKKEFSEITLGVDERNEKAFRFYKEIGYRKFKEEKGDEGEIIICMKKHL
ncbi:MAG: GNAT family N-acetyltransferase [Candidatus Paceibacterota bacterium]